MGRINQHYPAWIKWECSENGCDTKGAGKKKWGSVDSKLDDWIPIQIGRLLNVAVTKDNSPEGRAVFDGGDVPYYATLIEPPESLLSQLESTASVKKIVFSKVTIWIRGSRGTSGKKFDMLKLEYEDVTFVSVDNMGTLEFSDAQKFEVYHEATDQKNKPVGNGGSSWTV